MDSHVILPNELNTAYLISKRMDDYKSMMSHLAINTEAHQYIERLYWEAAVDLEKHILKHIQEEKYR
jgi:hypothetical protein